MSASPFDLSTPRLNELKKKLVDFCEQHVVPASREYERFIEHSALKNGGNRFAVVPPQIDELKAIAKKLGLWNLWMPKSFVCFFVLA